LEIGNTGTATFGADLVIDNDLTITSGAGANLAGNEMTVEGMLLNLGTLTQTKDAPQDATTEFLRITDTAGTTDKHFGIELTPSDGSMGATMVSIAGGQRCAGTANTIQRCFEITPTARGSATTRFYYRAAEAVGHSSPKVYHWNGSTWDELEPTASGGSGDGLFVEATTNAYSPFTLGDAAPTRVVIGRFRSRYLPVDALLETFFLEGGRDALLRLLGSYNADLAAELVGADTEQISSALTAELDADGDGSVALLDWSTLEQHGTVGFDLERQIGDGPWVRINPHLLPAIIDSPLGAEYRLIDRDALASRGYRYRLIEHEAWGSTRQYGPWPLQSDP
jgi:hypothetical protein